MIAKKTVEQYEAVRKSGITNMYDYYAVMRAAEWMKFSSLASLSSKKYMELLRNFGKLMKKYNIKQ